MQIEPAAATSSAEPASAAAAPLPFLSPIFTDHMVLQRGMDDALWGWAKPGDKVVVRAATPDGNRDREEAGATAGSDGRWMAKLPALPVGGPYTVAVTGSGGESDTLQDVESGDVWVCSGQSNMQYGIGNVNNADAEIADAASYPQIRFFYVPKSESQTAQDVVQGGPWDVCSSDTAKKDGSWNGITAVGYFFCRDLYKATHVPIGLISTSVGGTPAEAWTSVAALQAKMPDIVAAMPSELAAEQIKPADFPDLPGSLFNTMINPLIPYGIKGYVWYQGESNAGRGYAYRTLLPTLIGDWRSRWDEGNTPFLIVQLAGWQNDAGQTQPADNSIAEVRDAQALTAQTVRGAYLATAVDIGDKDNIHPKNKQETGRRLALIAEREVYGEKSVQDMGPTFKSLKIQGGDATVAFNDAPGGLVVAPDGQPVAGFAIAGADHKWAWATATVAGSSVTLSAPTVPQPIAVRYAWAGWLPLNLYNKAGLPVYPFRTDNWKLASQP